MSSLINKAKGMMSRDKNDNENTNFGNDQGYYESTTNPSDPNTAGGYGNQNYSGSSNAGPHNSNMANKLDPRVDSDRDHRNNPDSTYGSNTRGGEYTGETYSGSTNAGPHSSNLANKADPRFDSDRDHRNDPTSTYGSTTGGGEYTSQTASGSTNAGPHNSNMANKMDPRVDSDRDNRNDPTSRVGGYGQQENYGASGANPAPSGRDNTGTGYGRNTDSGVGDGYSQQGMSDNQGYGQQGMASSQGYDRQGGMGDNQGYGRQGGMGGNQGFDQQGGMTGNQGYGQQSMGGNQGYDQQGGMAGQQGMQGGQYDDNYQSSATPGSGKAGQTAGPHNSNLMNKLDPRVDSDMDGSKTYGGNKTHY